ncbi:MAG: cbb3-type cytochrome c oxidase subunit I [Acidobacteriota bacterium]
MRKLALAHVLVSVAAFGLAAMMAVMQAMSRADLQLPARTADLYYLSVTAHGVLMGLVFTTFFIIGFGYVIVEKVTGRIVGKGLAWAGFWVALAGTLLATVAILSGRASVLYTFYPPMKAHPAFYIGAALLVVGSWAWAIVTLRSFHEWRKENPGRPAHVGLHGMVATAWLWLLCTLGVAVEVVVLLIPWSLGWVERIDPVLARTLFWYFGHPVVYFWLLPAYVAWYALLPRVAGGKLFSDKLTRMVFVLFLILSTPVGLHHQFVDPGIASQWKLFHAILTFGILFPSMVTAFTVIASLELGGRARGGRGLFGWIFRLPWGDPLFAAIALAMLTFATGGWGGAVNAAYGMNAMVHNTAWVQGHFHMTVGTASALTFMGLTYWLLPRLTGRELKFLPFAQVQPWLWFVGMCFFSIANHVTGLMGMPRRVYEASYGGAEQAQAWAPWTAVSAAGGVILFVSASCFGLVVVGTLLWGRRLSELPPIELAEPLEAPAEEGLFDRFGTWVTVAVVLVVIAYAIPLYQLLTLPRFGAPPQVPF